ncbi:putative DEAD/DEAH box ATP-dependent RNA helicase [Plasmodium gaboni]|uniref:Putative DEAD/DEAH box ATP-dependent RNA helicase n=1 Tax=Plasmodium gaboni TaxID=647221 RepID=A0A151LH31_9APIC|nr:putative DEAD/DEAH box ATP-dependent RNA helicase [Plasmodium gaboni]KYN98295.1 putative DEAD/DEAH box ATP-dependent RNA helicase [Plasmodium gaboni]
MNTIKNVSDVEEIKEESTKETTTTISTNNKNCDKHNKNNNTIIDMNCLWSDLYISRPFLKVLYEQKFSNPTYIQRDVIPLALEGKSILANSETGSGKTLAFVLPILERLLQSANIRMRRNNMKASYNITKALILLPTRELSLQCYDVIRSLTKYVTITYSLFCGGIDIKQQEYEYKKRNDIFICTPGRILDLLLNSSSDFINYLEIVVFDEADKLLELGFKEECLKILDVCKFKKQILFFSATLTNDIKQLVNFSLKNPVFVQSGISSLKDKDLQNNDNNNNNNNIVVNNIITKNFLKLTNKATFKISEGLKQEFVNIIQEKYRKASLLYLCNNIYKNHCIIFFKTKRETHLMFLLFDLLNLKCAELHGSMSQKRRIESIMKFKKAEVDFLLTTELASRGIDIDHVLYVINYNIPSNVIKYVHRIGRTARIGKEGIASTLYLQKEKIQVKKIVKGLKKSKNLKILKRTIAENNIHVWHNIIKQNKQKLNDIIEQEKIDKQIEISNKSIDKIKNLITFKDEIMSRPPRTWFLTGKEKQNLKNESKKYDKDNNNNNINMNDNYKGHDYDDDNHIKKKNYQKENNKNISSFINYKKGKNKNNKNNKNNKKGNDEEDQEQEQKKKLQSYRKIIRDLKLNMLYNKSNKSQNKNNRLHNKTIKNKTIKNNTIKNNTIKNNTIKNKTIKK